MREIRFRAWGHQGNDKYRMFYGVALSTWIVPYWQDMAICDHELMQFTGLKDKKGKEIFEGDILINKTERICKVHWHDYAGAWDCEPLNDKGDPRGFKNSHLHICCEIIGNIFEHSNLIEEKEPK